MSDQPTYTHTVHDFTDKSRRKHCTSLAEATDYANDLLRQGHQVKIYDYKPARRYVDVLAERGPDFKLSK